MDVAPRARGPIPIRRGDVAGHTAPTGAEALELGPAIVSSALLPTNRLNRSIRIALSAFADHAVRYEDRVGNLRLRRQIARLVSVRALPVRPTTSS